MVHFLWHRAVASWRAPNREELSAATAAAGLSWGATTTIRPCICETSSLSVFDSVVQSRRVLGAIGNIVAEKRIESSCIASHRILGKDAGSIQRTAESTFQHFPSTAARGYLCQPSSSCNTVDVKAKGLERETQGIKRRPSTVQRVKKVSFVSYSVVKCKLTSEISRGNKLFEVFKAIQAFVELCSTHTLD